MAGIVWIDLDFKSRTSTQLLGVFLDFFGAGFRAKEGMAEGDHPGVVRPDAINGTGAETEDHPQQPIRPDYSRGPGVHVLRKSYSCRSREEIIIEMPSDYLLNENAHPFIEIEQVVVLAVKNGPWAEDAGKHLLQCACEFIEPDLDLALICNENRVVFARKSISDVVLQQAGRADYERMFRPFPEKP